jgi:hypothetical protein
MRHLKAAVAAAILVVAGLVVAGLVAPPVAAQADPTAPVVVELYTSQGCASCPPVDAFFAELADRTDVIALALHVDYWDYMGWRDVFAQRAFTDRQRSYARAARQRMVFTPQIIVGGTERIAGFRPMQVIETIAAVRAAGQPVRLTLERSGPGRIAILAEALRPLEGAAVVTLVRYRPTARLRIERGDNAGRTFTYRNIVTAWEELAGWDGKAAFRAEARAEGEEPAVVIVQQAGYGPVLAAARAPR